MITLFRFYDKYDFSCEHGLHKWAAHSVCICLLLMYKGNIQKTWANRMEIAYLDASKWIRYWVFLVQSNKYCYFCPPDGTYVNISSGGKSCSIYLIWTKNTQYPIYWFVSKYASSMLLAKVLYTLFIVNLIQHGTLPLLDDAFILMKRKIYLQIIMFCLKFFIFFNSLLHIMYEHHVWTCCLQ